MVYTAQQLLVVSDTESVLIGALTVVKQGDTHPVIPFSTPLECLTKK